jgi:hypothetical protein
MNTLRDGSRLVIAAYSLLALLLAIGGVLDIIRLA